jgi:hypothetical protein
VSELSVEETDGEAQDGLPVDRRRDYRTRFEVLERDHRARADSIINGRLLLMLSGGIAFGILVLIGVLLVAALVQRDPTPKELSEGGSGQTAISTNAINQYMRARTERFQVIKDLTRLLVVALVVPLMTIVLGYIFGRQQLTAPRPGGGKSTRGP